MASFSSYKIGYPKRVLRGYHTKPGVLGVVMSGPQSRLIDKDIKEGGNLVQRLNFELTTPSTTVDLMGADGYYSGITNMDPTLTYTNATSSQVVFHNDLMAAATSSMPFADEVYHQSSDALMAAIESDLLLKQANQIETDLVSYLVANGAAKVGPTTDYDMNASSESAVLEDFTELTQEADKRNWEAGSNRWILAHTELKSSVIPFDAFNRKDFSQPNNPLTSEGLREFAGWNFAYSNNIPSGTALAVDLNKVACVINKPGIQKIDNYVPALKNYIRAWSYFGYGIVGAVTTHGDGTSTNSPREGVLRLTVTI